VGNGSESVSLREWFDERFEGLERAITRVEGKLDCVGDLKIRVAVLETRQKWLFAGLGGVLMALIGFVVERLLEVI